MRRCCISFYAITANYYGNLPSLFSKPVNNQKYRAARNDSGQNHGIFRFLSFDGSCTANTASTDKS